MKKFITVTLFLLLLLALSLPVCAAESELGSEYDSDIISPPPGTRNLCIKDYQLKPVEKNGSVITASAYTLGMPNATKLWVRIDLFRRVDGTTTWVLWKSGTTQSTTTMSKVSTSESWSGCVAGYDYRVTGSHTGNAGQQQESFKTYKYYYN